MRELRLNREINPNGQILRDDKGNLTGISLSSDLVKIRNLSIDTLTSSTGTIPTEGSLYFEGSEGLRFNLVDSFTEKSGALTSSGDVAVGMNRWANALTQLWIYEPIASPVDYFNITVLANGATSINTIDIAGSDASLSLISDGDLNFTPLTGDVLVSSSTSLKPSLTLKNTTNDANPSSLNFVKDKGAVGADNDIVGRLSFTSDNDAQEQIEFARIDASVADASDSNEGGKLELQVASHDGEIVTGLSITDGSEEDEVEVAIASGTSSRTTVAGALTMYGETLTLQNTTSSHPQILITNTNADANGGNIHFYKNSTSTADNDSLGTITWEGNNDNLLDGAVTPCRIDGQFLDVSDGAEKGRINLDVAEYDGTLTTGLTVFGTTTNGRVDVTIGAATNSVTTVAGALSPQGAINLAQDMYLTVGNADDYIYGDGTEIYLGKDGSDIVIYKDAEILQEVPLKIREAASAVADTAAYGQIWVKTATPNELYFTNDAGNDIQLTSGSSIAGGGGGGSTTLVWHATVGGYKVNNNSSTTYYTFYRHWYENWSNGDSSPTTISASDSYASFMIAPAAGTLTGVKIVGTASDSGFDDPFKFYMFKGTVGNDATSTSLTAIGTTSSITPSTANRTWTHSESFSSSNSFSAGDSLYIWLKKDSTSGNQDLYWNLTLFGEYS